MGTARTPVARGAVREFDTTLGGPDLSPGMLRIGAHTSIAGGAYNAVDEQVEYGGNCGQIFSHSPQVWQDPDIGDDEADQFRERTTAHDIGPWVIHSSYLVNLCTPKEDLREKSVDSMQQEVDAADRLGVEYVNVHLGAHTGAGDRKSTRLNSSHIQKSRMPSSA